MSNEITTPTKAQREFLDWYEDEKANGLEDIKFFPGETSQATVDDVLKTAIKAVIAYREGRYKDLSNM